MDEIIELKDTRKDKYLIIKLLILCIGVSYTGHLVVQLKDLVQTRIESYKLQLGKDYAIKYLSDSGYTIPSKNKDAYTAVLFSLKAENDKLKVKLQLAKETLDYED